MARKPITLKDFTKGFNLKGDCFGDPGIMRLSGFKFGTRPGALESRGGVVDWDTPSDFQELQGIKRWYDSDGGSTFFAFGNDGSNYGLWRYDIESKTVAFLQQDTDFDRHAIVQFVNCDNQLIYIPEGKKDAPYSVKLKNDTTRLSTQKLGLNRPTDAFTVTATGYSTPSTWIEGNKTYKWYLSYSYGTKTEPNKYGESALSDPITLTLPTVTGSWDAIIANFTGISLLVRRINIYRTLGDGNTPYLIGTINETGVTQWTDNVNDSLIDLSKTAPIYTGLPEPMRCAMWHPTLKRLFWFGYDGYFHWGAAGYADINPATQKMEVGSLAYPGWGIHLIRNSIYGFKEDGIYLIQGDSPNYFSTKISDVQCKSRGSIVDMQDGIYFLGVEYGRIKFYRFNGNNASSISESIEDMLPTNKDSVFKRVSAKKVGDEYWASLMITDKRYCNFVLPFNNVVLMYDTRYQAWAGSFPIQAADIEMFDGAGDSGELFFIESDNVFNTSKGTFFRFSKHSGIVNSTTYSAGVRSYTKGVSQASIISFGVIPGIEEDGSLENLAVFKCKVKIRGYQEEILSHPQVEIYDDSSGLTSPIVTFVTPELANLKWNDYDTTSIAAGVAGVGKVGSAICFRNFSENVEFIVVDDKLRTGIIANILFDHRHGKILDVEAIELNFSNTNNQ